MVYVIAGVIGCATKGVNDGLNHRVSASDEVWHLHVAYGVLLQRLVLHQPSSKPATPSTLDHNTLEFRDLQDCLQPDPISADDRGACDSLAQSTQCM